MPGLTTIGFHPTLDARTAVPRPFVAYYPALIKQNDVPEWINLLESGSIIPLSTGSPGHSKSTRSRESYNPETAEFINGHTKSLRLRDITLARSGDKGGNLNFGIFPKSSDHWLLRWYMAFGRMKDLLDHNRREEFNIERVEFPRIQAAHFAIYGTLGRGFSSSRRLDRLERCLRIIFGTRSLGLLLTFCRSLHRSSYLTTFSSGA